MGLIATKVTPAQRNIDYRYAADKRVFNSGAMSVMATDPYMLVRAYGRDDEGEFDGNNHGIALKYYSEELTQPNLASIISVIRAEFICQHFCTWAVDRYVNSEHCYRHASASGKPCCSSLRWAAMQRPLVALQMVV